MLRVTHPGYISRKLASPMAVVEILLGRNGGDPTFFETIRLARGVEYTGQFVMPNGTRRLESNFELAHWGADPNPSDQFADAWREKPMPKVDFGCGREDAPVSVVRHAPGLFPISALLGAR